MSRTVAIAAHLLTFMPFTVMAAKLLWTVTKVRITREIFLTFSSVLTFGVVVTLQLYNKSSSSSIWIV